MKILTMPNLLSIARLSLVPVLIWLAINGKGVAFLWVISVSLVTDILDGYLARKLNDVTDLGAKLDSWGDALTYGVMIFSLYYIWPQIYDKQALFLFSATMSFIVPLLFALARFGVYPSYHTLGAKLAALCIAPAYYVLIIFDADVFFRGVILFYLAVALEEISITLLLEKPRTDVSSVWHLMSEKRR